MAVNKSEEIIKITLDTGSGAVQINGIASSLENARGKVQQFTQSQKEMNTQLQKGVDKTGLAGAAVVELGRTISDSNYGFTAMANNISQLSTLFTTLIATTGGVANGLKAMWAALTGPLGIIVAFQVFIAVLEKVAMNSKKSSDELKELDETIKNLSETLDLQEAKLDTFGRWAVSGKNELETLKREFKELGAYLNSLSEEEQKNQDIIAFAIKQQGELLRLRKEQAVINAKLKAGEGDRNELLIQLAKFEAQESAVLAKLLPQKREELILTNKTNKTRLANEKYLYTISKFLRKEDLESLEDYWKRRAEIEKNTTEAQEQLRQKRLSELADGLQATSQLIGAAGDILNAEYKRQLTLEQNKTNAINNELKARLRNEALSMEQRKNIQNQIAQNDEKLRLKQLEIEKKKFKANKAIEMSNAIVNTAAAATGVLKDTKGGSIARIAGMIAVIGAGLAQVAIISRQKFQTSAASMTGGVTNVDTGDGGGAIAGPSFNVVGQSGSNQLARAVSGQLSKPVKAYVVSKDVSTSQEMDRNVVKTASLG
jgi:hypothetical protein